MLPKNQIVAFRSTAESETLFLEATGVDEAHPDGTGWTLTSVFNHYCLWDQEQVEDWCARKSVDPRYQVMVEIANVAKKPNHHVSG